MVHHFGQNGRKRFPGQYWICEGTPFRHNDEPLMGKCWFCSGALFWESGRKPALVQYWFCGTPFGKTGRKPLYWANNGFVAAAHHFCQNGIV